MTLINEIVLVLCLVGAFIHPACIALTARFQGVGWKSTYHISW